MRRSISPSLSLCFMSVAAIIIGVHSVDGTQAGGQDPGAPLDLPSASKFSQKGAESTSSFYLLAAGATGVVPYTWYNYMNLYELNFSAQNGSLQSVSAPGWNISQPPTSVSLVSFYIPDSDTDSDDGGADQENIYWLEPSSDGYTENLLSYSVSLNETRDIFTQQPMPGNNSDCSCARYDPSTQTVYVISASFNRTAASTTLRIVALSEAQGFAAPSQSIYEMNFEAGSFKGFLPLGGEAACSLIPADVAGTSTSLLSFAFDLQLYTIAVTPTSGVLYASPGNIPLIIGITPTFTNNSEGNVALFYVSVASTSGPFEFGTIDMMTGMYDVLIPDLALSDSAATQIAFDPRANPPMLLFASFSLLSLPFSVEWVSVGIERAGSGGNYERIMHTNNGSFPIPGHPGAFGEGLIGLFPIGFSYPSNSFRSKSQSTPIIADW